MYMLKYATRLPPGKPVSILDNGMIRKRITTPYSRTVTIMESLINYFKSNPDPKVVSHSNFKSNTIDHIDTRNKTYYYQYDMMRCGLLSIEERKFVDLIGDQNDRGRAEIFQQTNIKIECKKFPKLSAFLKQVVLEGRYWDIHSGNVMLNEDLDYVLIDLEGFVGYPASNSRNDWFML